MTNANEFESYVDAATGAVVVSEVPPEEINETLSSMLSPQVQRALASWAEDKNPTGRRNRGIFERDRYVTPNKVYEQMGMSYDALDDDLVGNVADMSESLAFQKLKFESEDKDQEDVWNQIGRDLNLDEWVRQAWRELFTVSQFYGVRVFGSRNYKVRGKTDSGVERRKSFDAVVPTHLGFLDPTRVVPVQQNIFGNRQLAWIASPTDNQLLSDESVDDPLIKLLFTQKYEPTPDEIKWMGNEGIETGRLWLLNPEHVFSHTLTKSPFERWSRIRMKSIFPLLDLKHQLREMDRAWLLGGINFIVLVTRGTDQIPTTRTEVEGTAAQVRSQSKSPIIVTDHRINIEIITPDVEHVLASDKWAVLDERITSRLWGTFMLSSEASNRETSATIGKVIVQGLQSRRHMLKRTIEKEVIRATTEIPMNPLSADTKLEFSPRRMQLEQDAALATILQELRDRGDISRESLLNEFDFDQSLEAQRRETEDKRYKKIFMPVNVPFDSPTKTTPSGSGKKSAGNPEGKNSGQ